METLLPEHSIIFTCGTLLAQLGIAMATIRKRGNKYHVQIRLAGSPPVTKSFTTKKDAQLWARQTEIKHDQNELSPNRNSLKHTTLSELVVRYCDEVVSRKRCGQTDMITLNAFIKLPIAQKTLSQITKADFAKYRDERLLLSLIHI